MDNKPTIYLVKASKRAKVMDIYYIYIEYMDILIGENLSSNLGAYMELIYCSVRSSSGRGWVWWMVGILILTSYAYQFIRVDENIVQHPNNNISITKAG